MSKVVRLNDRILQLIEEYRQQLIMNNEVSDSVVKDHVENILEELDEQHIIFYALLFASLLFTAICKASLDSHFAFLHFFSMGMVLIPISCTMSRTSIHSSSGTLSDLDP